MLGALRLFLAVSLPLYVIDQITKFWVVMNFEAPKYVEIEGVTYLASYDKRVIVDGFFYLTRVHNTGVAWGFGNGTSWAPIVFFFIPVVALSLIIWYWKQGGFDGKLGRASASLLVAGILGNLTDRLVQGFFLEEFADASFWTRLSQGYVVDFLDVMIPIVDYNYPVFNVADSCICVAAVLFFIHGVRQPDEPKDPPAEVEVAAA